MKRASEVKPQSAIRCHKGIPVELLQIIPCDKRGHPVLTGRPA